MKTSLEIIVTKSKPKIMYEFYLQIKQKHGFSCYKTIAESEEDAIRNYNRSKRIDFIGKLTYI